MHNTDLVSEPWADYELIDSGAGAKLERFGEFTLIRPETQALWQPQNPAVWKKAAAEFSWKDGKGSWKKKDLPAEWEMGWKDARFIVRPTSFKHVGVFPEQSANWEWLTEKVSARKKILGEAPKVLNLFGYTGIASIVSAKAGALVTHVDSSKQSNVWAKTNAELSGLPEDAIHYVLEDALKFAAREARRGARYDGIILDPPAFGRGAKSEVWKIEEGLPKLLEALEKILIKQPGAFFLLNGYAAGYSPLSFKQVLDDVFQKPQGEFGELHIRENTGRSVPSGIYVRFNQ